LFCSRLYGLHLCGQSCGPVQAIANDPGNAELYAARAQTRLKLENYLDAIEDASKALDLNPRLAKAHQRKGCAAAHRFTARSRLGRLGRLRTHCSAKCAAAATPTYCFQRWCGVCSRAATEASSTTQACAAASAREAGGRSCARVKLSHAPGRRVAFFNLEEYESAKAAFEAAHALEARRETATWIRKCDAELHGAAPQQPFLHAACLQEALGAPPLSELPGKAPCVTGLPPTRSYPALRTCWQ